jgi:hypothetical protein
VTRFVGEKLVAVLDGVAARLDQRRAKIVDGVLREQELAGEILHRRIDRSEVLEVARYGERHLLDLGSFLPSVGNLWKLLATDLREAPHGIIFVVEGLEEQVQLGDVQNALDAFGCAHDHEVSPALRTEL